MIKNVLLLIFLIYSELIFGQDKIVHRKITDLPNNVYESSGIVIQSADKIWTHSDAGYDNRLFLVDSNGQLLRTVIVANVANNDWEDLSFDIDSNLWINDAGNNSNARKNLAIYSINKDQLLSKDTVNADRIITFSYSDQTEFPPPNRNMNFDIEAMFVLRDSVCLITKNRSNPTNGFAKLYVLPAESGNYVAQLVDSFFVDEDMTRSRITAADIHLKTNKIAMLTRTQIIEFWDYQGFDIFKGTHKRYFFNSRTNQVEALAYLNETTFYMTDEGSPANQVPGAWYEVKKDDLLNINHPVLDFTYTIQWNSSDKVWNIEGIEGKSHQIVISNLNGQKMHHSNFKKQIAIDAKKYPKGIYILQISNGNEHHSCKYFIH